MSDNQTFDAIVIGTGQAGPSMASRCANEGLKTAVIEKDKFGGTCVNTGCTPTKAMVASARVAHVARRGNDFGVEIGDDIKVNLKKVKARKDKLVKNSTEGVENWLRETKNLTVFKGHARFTGNHTVQVGNQTLTAEKIFINTGAKPFVPPALQHVNYMTNADILELEKVPEHLIIVGGSYIGLEFGQMFRRFGSEITIIEQGDEIIGREDSNTSETLRNILEEEGIRFRLQSECISATQKGSQITVNLKCSNGTPTITGTHLLVATGRRPNTDDLGLEHTDIKLNDRKYIATDDTLKTSVDGVWALGDVNGKGAFTHTAYNDFEIVAANLFDNDSRKVSDRILNYALYTDPSLSHVGMYEQEARQSDKNIWIGYREMSRIARAKERGETKGFIKILVDADTKKILGATILGIDGDEIIHSILDIMYADQPYTIISRAVHTHPTISELIPTILQNLKPLD
ncbi:FAD-containing oxidoreductase [Rhodohalobacter sp.]|uniref:FAD-containing oxidoreductase n=1 Tax=Rhodohalobacter sp. TaxID=1974210 RepID=UPI002ACE14FB|nr:FAD-containing oxidoreductase [Rhodohalobacter sp.]MDZ7755550.1 FAD-containing oxidoreductase [Rhodohalobacter sp.]